LLLLTALAGAVVWRWWRDPVVGVGAREKVAATATTVTETVLAPRAEGAGHGAPQEAVREGDVPSFADAPKCVVGPEGGLRVHVVASDGRTNVAAARVYVLSIGFAVFAAAEPSLLEGPGGTPSLLDLAASVFADPASLTSLSVGGYLADANGEARVECPSAGAVLIGFADGLRGALRLSAPGDAPVEFALAKPEDRRIEVVARDGRPIAGARVGLARLRSENGRQVPIALHQGAVTDASGRVRLFGCEIARTVSLRGVAIEKSPLVASVALVGSGGDAAWAELPPPAPGDAIVRVTVAEPFGVLEVRAVDAEHRVADMEGTVILHGIDPARASDSKLDAASDPPLMRRLEMRRLERGVARFAPIALEQAFAVRLFCPKITSAEKAASGPLVDGDVVRVDFRTATNQKAVHGRLVGIAPLPGADALFVVHVANSARPRRLAPPPPATLADGGLFRIEITPKDFLEAERLELEVTLADRSAAYGASVGLEELPNEEEVDVGDVVATPMTPLVAGRVVDDLGRPVSDVTVEIRSGASGPYAPANDFVNRMKTGGAGLFAFFRPDEGADLVLVAAPPRGFLASRVPFEPGVRDLEVVVQRAGVIEGTIENRRGGSVLAQPLDGGDAIPEIPAADTFSPGSARDAKDDVPRVRPFRLELRPGRYDVFAKSGSHSLCDHLLAHVGDLVVRAGETTTDPRLSPLLLSDRDFRWRIELARRDGGAVPSAWICLAPAEVPNEYWNTDYCATGVAEFDAALGSAWVDVFSASFRRVHQLCSEGAVTITLEPVDQDEVAFELAAEASADLSRLEFRVVVDQDPPLPRFMRDQYSATLAVGRTARISIDEGAHWRAHLFLARAGEASGSSDAPIELPRHARDVAASPDPIRFDVSAAEVAEARARLEARKSR
jgi:hypothetical protein